MQETKPDQPAKADQTNDTSRRSLIVGAIYAIPFLIGGTLMASVGNYLLGKQTDQKDGWADAGDVSDLRSGAPRQVVFDRVVMDGWKIAANNPLHGSCSTISAISPHSRRSVLTLGALIAGRLKRMRSVVHATAPNSVSPVMSSPALPTGRSIAIRQK